MLTVLEALNKSVDYLDKKEIESPRTNAELLLASILKCKRLDLYMMYDRPLSEDELGKYREYLKRRRNFEPLQYIIGKVEFYGLELDINPHVLIPRPETEVLVENVINTVNKDNPIKILDIGSGSGNISLALAANLPKAKIKGIDVSNDSLKIATENSKSLQLDNRVSFYCEDIFNFDEEKYSDFDAVVSNPPYVSEKDYLTVQKEIKNYEPDFAVTDFSDGYKFFQRIICISKKILKTGGHLFFEVAKGQSEKVQNYLMKNNFKNIIIKKDYQGIERVISGENF